MKTKNFNNRLLVQRTSLAIISIALMFSITAVFAADNTDLSITINAGSLDVDIVDASGDTVADPGVAMSVITFGFEEGSSTGTMGSSVEKIRVYNPTAISTWSLSLAATSGATALWSTSGSETMDYNQDGGAQMTIDPSGGTIISHLGNTANISLGSSTAFVQGTTDSITLATAAAAASTYDYFDITGISLSQVVPAEQEVAAYTLNMTLTVTN